MTACYLYCLTPSVIEAPVRAPGVDGQHPVSVLACGGMGAVFSEVDEREFSGESAQARLSDLAWLGPRVCRHEAVVEEIMGRAPVLPVRFATLFATPESLRRAVAARRDPIAHFFAWLGDRREWAVKGLLDRARALNQLRDRAESAASAASPGAGYFEEKRAQAALERQFNSRLKEFCRDAAASLGAEAGAFRERRIVAETGTSTGIVFNWAFLLAPAQFENFRLRIERLNGPAGFPGLALALTGPWPPHSFAPDLSAGGEA